MPSVLGTDSIFSPGTTDESQATENTQSSDFEEHEERVRNVDTELSLPPKFNSPF